MVRNLLAITRIDAGALELRRDWIDLREIVARVVNAARRRGAVQRIDVEVPPDLPLVRADAALAEQAIGNIVANALVHTPPETHIVIDALTGTSGVAVRVRDNGPGIAAAILPHVFDRFAKGPGADASRDGREGAGLGLAIAKGIMDAHGGSIEAESPVDGHPGTRFVMLFPPEDVPV
jgi:two-component system sensor histidine kinase KdpD